jgi:hypothetical protein
MLEKEVLQTIEQATGRDPLMLSANTGLRPPGAPSVQEELTLIYSMIGGIQTALLQVAREIDKTRGK